MNDYLKLNLSFLHDIKSISKLKFFFYNFNRVPIDMNHIPPHSLTMPSLLRFIFFYFERKEGHESLQIMHQDNFLIISL